MGYWTLPKTQLRMRLCRPNGNPRLGSQPCHTTAANGAGRSIGSSIALSSGGDWKGPSWSVVSGGWKLVLFAGNQYPAEVYDLTTDSAERHNLGLSARPELLDLIADWRERIPEGAG